jgi:hypothetical protein
MVRNSPYRCGWISFAGSNSKFLEPEGLKYETSRKYEERGTMRISTFPKPAPVFTNATPPEYPLFRQSSGLGESSVMSMDD